MSFKRKPTTDPSGHDSKKSTVEPPSNAQQSLNTLFQTLGIIPSPPPPPSNHLSLLTSMGGILPNEIISMIFAAALEPETKPIINFLQTDFCRENYANQTLDPAFYLPQPESGGEDTYNLSSYRSGLNIGQTCYGAYTQSKKAPDLNRQVAKSKGKKLVEITAQVKRDEYVDITRRDEEEFIGKTVSFQMDPEKDILCLQAPVRDKTNRYITSNWFKTESWIWYKEQYFRPLWPQGIDKMERLAIDWKVETTRGSITQCCGNKTCCYLRNVFRGEMYLVKGSDRKYCSACLGAVLDGLDAMVDRHRALAYFIDGEFGNPRYPGAVGRPDEEGSFECESCQIEYPCGEGRLPNQEVSWEPTCLNWHQPYFNSDIETLFMGRMRKMRDFYIVCTDITLKEGRKPRGECEEFAGHGARFVVVDEDDDCWDLSRVRGKHGTRPNSAFVIDPFRYAEGLEDVAWENMWQFPHIYAARTRKIREADRVAGPDREGGDGDVEMVDAAADANANRDDDNSAGNNHDDEEDGDAEDPGVAAYLEEWGLSIPPLEDWYFDDFIGHVADNMAPDTSGIRREDKYFPVKCKILACIKD